MQISIIYEDQDILVVSKPAGLQVHAALHNDAKQKTLVDWLKENRSEVLGVGDDPKLRPGIVHRLDKDTSGVLVVAKNQPAFEFLKKQFQEKVLKKTYLALVHGMVKNDTGIINRPIGASRSDFRKRSSFGNLRGKVREAVTEYKVVQRLGEFTLLECYPKTGRTHQIRVHLKFLGHPVAGDKLYGGKKTISPEGLTRQFLHAKSLQITLPSGGKAVFEADLPEDLANVLKLLQKG